MTRFIYKYGPGIGTAVILAFCVIISLPVVQAQDFSIQPYGPTSLTELLNIIIYWIFRIAIPIAIIMIIVAGLMMLTAGGNQSRFEKGKKTLWYAILGLVIIFIGKGFISLIKSILELRA